MMDLTHSLSGLFENTLVVGEQSDKKDTFSNEFVGFRSWKDSFEAKSRLNPTFTVFILLNVSGFASAFNDLHNSRFSEVFSSPSCWVPVYPKTRKKEAAANATASCV